MWSISCGRAFLVILSVIFFLLLAINPGTVLMLSMEVSLGRSLKLPGLVMVWRLVRIHSVGRGATKLPGVTAAAGAMSPVALVYARRRGLVHISARIMISRHLAAGVVLLIITTRVAKAGK